jgi:hypothetical protein
VELCCANVLIEFGARVHGVPETFLRVDFSLGSEARNVAKERCSLTYSIILPAKVLQLRKQ